MAHSAGRRVRGALGLLAALASFAALPGAAAAARPRACPGVARFAAIQVGGISCRSADGLLRAAGGSGTRLRGFACRSRRSGAIAIVSCRRGNVAIGYRTPLRSLAPSSPLRIDAAVATPTAHPVMVEEGRTLRLELTISDRTPWADSILVYATVPGQPCATTFQGAQGGLPVGSAQEEIGEGVEALIDRARGTRPSGTPGPLDATFSIDGNVELTSRFSAVCAILYSSSTYGFPTRAAAQAAITAG